MEYWFWSAPSISLKPNAVGVSYTSSYGTGSLEPCLRICKEKVWSSVEVRAFPRRAMTLPAIDPTVWESDEVDW